MFTRTAAESDPTNAPHLARLGDLLSEWEADALAAHQARVTQTPRGAVTGLPALDRELGGALSSGLHILHAGPGAGKTALALQAAASCGCPALYVSAEMARLELFRRHTARVTETYLGRLRSGELLPADSLALACRAAAAAPQLAIADATTAPAAPAWIRAAAEVTRGDSPYLLLVIDSLHSWADAIAEGAPEYEALNVALSALRGLAQTLSCAVLAIAERNRASMTSGGLSAGAGSRKLEYGGETVLGLSREKDTPPDAAGEVEVTLTIEKNRNGSPGRKLPLRFHGALQRFREP
ncbi:MAG TPA: DnaB-like helicase C-terminal domain-containing protein [Dehalococcoidia bacterium]|nr:DnaB-like helicase C-terminal domain-containing protein [Dehalococcoidia bacterium]